MQAFFILLFTSLAILDAGIASFNFFALDDPIDYSRLISSGVCAAIAFFIYLKMIRDVEKTNNTNTNRFAASSSVTRLKEIAEDRREKLAEYSKHTPLSATFLGGAGIDIEKGAAVYIGSTAEKFVIINTIEDNEFKISISEISKIEISGPGTETSNAGLIGGGFGLEGAVKGMLAAAVVNAVTTKSTTNTFLRITTHSAEVNFHFNDQEPSGLRLTLSPLFVAVESRNASISKNVVSFSDEILKLQSLKENGAISDEEFTLAKQKLLQR